MNTIQITTEDGAINFTESEVLRFIKKARQVDEANSNLNKVRDFFGEREWPDREATIGLDEVNELLESIGSYKIQTSYSGTITIYATFNNVDADTSDDAILMIQDELNDELNVELYSAEINVDSISVDDIEPE